MDPSGAGPSGAKAGGLAAWRDGDAVAAMREETSRVAAAQAAAAAEAKAAEAKARLAARRRALGPLAAELAGMKGPPPLPFQVKLVLELLRDADGAPRGFDELQEALPELDLSDGGALRAALLSNTRAAAVPGGLAYKSEHGVRGAEDLLRHLRAQAAGVPARRLKDAYKGVMDDVERLRAEGRLFKFWNSELQDDVLFAADERHTVKVRPDVAALYLETRPPEEPTELVAAVERLGQRSALKAVDRRVKVAMPERERKARRRRQQAPRTVTNVHLPGLFEGAAPETIDS